ncbi:MAG: hypothetical protein OXP09_10885 [Gammaproteobacteria bacterium]|nr:hypothetical protein [Gammaproteobacteria bacterium]
MLSATFVKSINVPGCYGDGRGGLGLGTYPVITLAMVRERALENARDIALGRGYPPCIDAVPHGFRSSFQG